MRKQGNDTFGSTKQLLCRKFYVVRMLFLTAVCVVYPNAATSGEGPQWCSAKKLNVTERTICSSSDLQRLDVRMADAYARAKTGNSRKDQISWLKERNSCGSDRTCIARSYHDRLATLDSGGAPAASDSASRSHQTAQTSQGRGSSTSDHAGDTQYSGEDVFESVGMSASDGIKVFVMCADLAGRIKNIHFTYAGRRGDRIVIRADVQNRFWTLLGGYSNGAGSQRVEIFQDIDRYQCIK